MKIFALSLALVSTLAVANPNGKVSPPPVYLDQVMIHEYPSGRTTYFHNCRIMIHTAGLGHNQDEILTFDQCHEVDEASNPDIIERPALAYRYDMVHFADEKQSFEGCRLIRSVYTRGDLASASMSVELWCDTGN